MPLLPIRPLATKGSLILLILFQLLFHCARAQLRQIYTDPQPDNQLQKLSFYSPNEGYVAFQDGIGYTTDSGRTFLKKTITLTNVNYNGYSVNLTFGFGISGVKAFDRNILIAYGDYGLVPSILYSVDGGNTFKLVFSSQFNPLQLRTGIMDMVFPQNGSIGYAVDADRLLKTTDRGLTWAVVRTDPGSYFTFLESIDNNTVFTFSTDYNSRKLLKTLDGGTSWQQLTIPNGQIEYASFLSANKGWLKLNPNGPTGELYYTSNGGSTWSDMNSVPFLNFRKMKFPDDSTGFAAVGFDVYKTTDSGKVWEPLPRDNTFSYLGYGNNDLQFFNAQLWAGGGHGFLQLGNQDGGNPLPKAYFSVDSSNFSFTGLILGINHSKPAYSCKWFVNHVLVSQNHNLSYPHSGFPLTDTIQLVVSNGMYTDTSVQYQRFYRPVIVTSFQPVTAGSGTLITIRGTNLSGANFVSFGGTPAATIPYLTDTTIKVTVGSGSSGDVVVATPQGRGSLPGFTFVPPPTITSFSPPTGVAGDPITIIGTNFTGVTAISFGSTPVINFFIVSPTQLTADAPSGSSGAITVTSPGGTATSATSFVEIPVIKSFSPTYGTSGTILTIMGTGLNGATAVSIGGTPARTYTVVSSTTITGALGQGATGAVMVTTPGGTASFPGFTYFPAPVINSFSPASGPVGTSVTITGAHFSPAAANNTVYFGAVRATNIVAASTTALTVIVPPGASWQPISVTTNTYTAYSIIPFLVTFPNGGSITTHSFAPPLYLPTGTGYSNPTSVTAGDLDGDGLPDLAVANLANFSISVIRNTGTPGSLSFEPKKDYTLGSEPNGIWMIDVDGDGKLDLVTSVMDDHKIVILRNTSVPGTISFDTAVNLPGATSPMAVTAADMDGDGRPDLVVTNYPDGTLSVLLNKGEMGTISFYPTTGYHFGAGGETSLSDIDGDGKLDLVIASPTGETVTVVRNISTNGAIAFGPPINLPTSYPYSVSTGDIDGDGKPDIAVVDANGNEISLFRNTSSGSIISFDKRIDLPGAATPVRIRLCDVDGDGQLDMTVASQQDGKVTVYKNLSHTGQISFGTGIDFAVGTIPQALALADLDLDGRNDIITSGNNTGLAILRNKVMAEPYVAGFTPAAAITGTAITITGRNFTGATTVSFGGTPAASFTVNSDTSITAILGAGSTGDIVVTNSNGQGAIAGFAFALVPSITSFSPLSGPVGTIITITGTNFSPNDPANLVTIGGIKATVLSSTDHSFTVVVPAGIAYAPITVTTHHLTAYSNNSFNTLFPGAATGFNSHSFGPRNDFPGGGAGSTADLDGDGKMDCINITGSNTVSVSRNTSSPGKISLAPAVDITTGSGPTRQAFGDLDGDGKLDMVTTNVTDGTISVLRNTNTPGALSFAPKIDFANSVIDFSNSNDMAIDDLDGDGKPDIIVSNYQHILSIFHNTTVNGVLSFVRQDFEEGWYATGLTMSDLDNDGKKDIALSVNGVPAVAIFKNTSHPGAISFATRLDIPLTGNWPESIKAVDVDGDGKPDLIVTLLNSAKITLLQNQSAPGSIAFAAQKDFPAGDMPSTVAIGDLDGDGKPDLSIQNSFIDYYSTDRILSIAKNTSILGQMAIQTKVDYALLNNTNPAGTAIADIDGDGKPDLISFGNRISIFRNQAGEASIANFTPVTGTAGTSVVITGIGFTGATNVRFGGVTAGSFIITSDTSITAIVGAGASGSVTVAKPGDTLALDGFTFIPTPPAPSITVTGPLQFCQGRYDTLHSSSSTGNKWYKNGVAITDTSAAIVTGAAGVYTLTVTTRGVTSPPSPSVVLTVNPVPAKPAIIADATGLLSSADAGNQWYIDTTTIIIGATDKRYSPSVKGSYTTRVTENGCSSPFSDRYLFVPPAATSTAADTALEIMPNPGTDVITVVYAYNGETSVNAAVVDFNGKVLISLTGLKSGDKIKIDTLAKGYYFLKVSSVDGKINVVKQFGKF